MIAIHKFVLPLLSKVIGVTPIPVSIPEGAQIRAAGFVPVAFGSQTWEPCVWAEVDTEAPLVMRFFRLYATGEQHKDPANEQYVGTVINSHGDTIVFHIYEVLK